jgi:Transposase domain (DUF772)
MAAWAMAQMSFFDAANRLAALSKQGDPPAAIAGLVPWAEFRREIEPLALTADADKKSDAGRKPIDVLIVLRMLALQSPYDFSGGQVEYQERDCLTVSRFLGLDLASSVPDGTVGVGKLELRPPLVPPGSRPRRRSPTRRLHALLSCASWPDPPMNGTAPRGDGYVLFSRSLNRDVRSR